MGSWKPGIKTCELGKEGSNLVSVTERMSDRIYLGYNLCWYKKILCS